MRNSTTPRSPVAIEDSIATRNRAILELERSILGAVLLDARRFREAREIVSAHPLDSAKHRAIWGAIESLVDSGIAPDLVTLRNELEASNVFDLAGGVDYLRRLAEDEGRSSSLASYGRQLRTLHGSRDALAVVDELRHVLRNGTPLGEHLDIVRKAAQDLADLAAVEPERTGATRLDQVQPEAIEYTVRDLFRKFGLTMAYGPAGVFKTFVLLWIATEMLAARCDDPYARTSTLFGDPRMTIRRPWRRVLWVSAEETAGALRARWDLVLTGMGLKPDDVAGELLHRWAFEDGRVLTIDKADAILAALPDAVDAVVFDSWTSLVPGTLDGAPIEWDADNYATRRLLNILRAIADRRKVLILVVHHCGHDKTHARGPSELRNAVDTLIRFERRPERRVQLHVEKQRDGADEWSTTIAVRFDREAVRVSYEEREAKRLTDTQQAVRAFLAGAGFATVADTAKATDLAKTTVRRVLGALQDAGLAAPTGEVGPKSSPIWHLTHVTQGDAESDAPGETA
jgi:hypothetical protein